jgi:hypothetical protein
VQLGFSSKAPKQSRTAVEDMLFLNPRQYRVREGILGSLEKFGHPRLHETVDGISVGVGDHEVQTLFAFDQSRRESDPVGIVVFLRTCPSDIVILHMAVHPDYALQGPKADLGVGIALMDKVKDIAARIVGVKRIALFYRQEIVIRI